MKLHEDPEEVARQVMVALRRLPRCQQQLVSCTYGWVRVLAKTRHLGRVEAFVARTRKRDSYSAVQTVFQCYLKTWRKSDDQEPRIYERLVHDAEIRSKDSGPIQFAYEEMLAAAFGNKLLPV